MRTIEMFLNFPIHDMNRNVLWRDPDKVDPKDLERMNTFWGDDSWREAAYRPEPDLFDPERVQKRSNERIAEAFRKRLKKVAKFQYVPKPLPMRNTKGAVVYYLFFASQKPVAEEIVNQIFDKYTR